MKGAEAQIKARQPGMAGALFMAGRFDSTAAHYGAGGGRGVAYDAGARSPRLPSGQGSNADGPLQTGTGFTAARFARVA